jgi:hypothetical protein
LRWHPLYAGNGARRPPLIRRPPTVIGFNRKDERQDSYN